MKTIFKLGVLSVIVVAVVAAFVYPEKVKLYAGTGKRMIQEKLDEAQGLETKLSLLETKVGGLDGEIARLKTEVIRPQVDVAYLEDLVDEKKQTHAGLRKALERASILLDEGKETYRIGGREYPRGSVERDAAEKLKIYKIQTETLDNLQETLRTKVHTLKLAGENVSNASALKAELIAKVRLLKADLEKYKAKEVYAETLKTDDLCAEFKTEMGRTQAMLSELEKQIAVKGRLLDERIRVGGNYIGGIDYTASKIFFEGDVSSEIEAFLNGAEAPKLAGAPQFN